jgi:hypothetical protein
LDVTLMNWAKALDRCLKNHPRLLPGLASWLGGLVSFILPFFQHWLLWFPDAANRRYLHGDFVEHFGPRSYVYQAISEGRLPLWDPFKETGLPTLDYLFDIFNPLILAINLFFLEDGLMRNHASQLSLVLHYSIGGLGAYLWVLSLGLGRTAALVMGVFWTSCGFVLIKSAGHDTVIHTTAWAPYMFMFLDRARRTGSLAASAWAGFFLGMLFLGGHPQYFYYFTILLALYGIYYAAVFMRLKGAETTWQILWRTFVPMAVVALLIASPQIMHNVGKLLGDGLARVHPSHDLGDLVFTSKGSGQLRYLPYFLFPNLERGFVETYVYPGVLPLIIGLMAIYYLRLKEEGYWKLVLIAGLVLFMGNNLGLHKVLIDLLPGYVLFRETERMILFAHIAIGMLTAYGLNWLLASNPPPDIKPANRTLAILAGVMALTLFLALAANHFNLPGVEAGGRHLVLNAMSAALLMLGAVWLILQRISQGHNTPGLRLFIAVLVILDLGFFHLPLTAHERHDFYPDPSHLSREQHNKVKFLKKLTQDRPARFYVRDHFVDQMAAYRHGLMISGQDTKYLNRVYSRPFWDILWRMPENPRFLDLWGAEYIQCGHKLLKSQRGSWKLLRGSQSAVDLEVPTAISSLEVSISAAFTQNLKQGETIGWLTLTRQRKEVFKWPLRWGKEVSGSKIALKLPSSLNADEILLSSAHPKALLTVQKIWLNGEPAQDRVRAGRAVENLCKNVRALPLAFFVQRASVLEPYPEYLDALTSVDPSRCVLFREAPPGYQAPAEPTLDSGGQTELVSFEPQRVELKVKADKAGYVVMSQTASFGWSARLNGAEIPIHKAYGFLCAVQVPPGQHTLEFVYQEPLVKVGLGIMLVGFAGLIFFTFWCRGRDWCRSYR